MKIKTKKQLTLPQLIEWVEKNEVRNHVFISDIDRNEVEINIHGCIFCKYITLKDTFTVEVEEVVDSDTVLDNIYTVNVEVGTSHTTYYKSKSINDVKTDEINIVYTILQEEAIVLWDSQGGFR